MSNDVSRLRRLVDATIITTVSTVVADILAGYSVWLYQQIHAASQSITEQRLLLEGLQKDVVRTQQLIIKELAPFKAHMDHLEAEHSTSLQDLRKHEEELDHKFHGEANNYQQIQQQRIP